MQYSKTFNILTIKIMKIFKFMTLALVAMLGFSSCSEDCDHEFIEIDHSADLVGTWTCIREDFAEALVIKADGSVVSTGAVFGEEYWENVAGNIVVKNGIATMTFEDGDNFKGHFDIIPGMAFSISNDEGRRFTYNYCKEDLSDEIVGMWVCHNGLPDTENDMAIVTYSEDGKMSMTTQSSSFIPSDLVNEASDYVVAGNLLFMKVKNQYRVARMVYAPNGTSTGDILTQTIYAASENGLVEITSSWLRVKQSLDLAGQNYNYIKTYVSNVKGEDKDINFMGYTFNFAKMDGSGLDKMLKALLFAVEFPDANTLGYSYQMNGNKETYNSPIVVEGNTMTIKMSEKVATLKDVVLYAFQDADCSQMHFYMHKTAFVNFYTNMQAMLMAATDEQFDITNAEAVNAIYDNINNAVQTINVSLVMSK